MKSDMGSNHAINLLDVTRDRLRGGAIRAAMAVAAGSLVLSACAEPGHITADSGEGYDCSIYIDAGDTVWGIMRQIYGSSVAIEEVFAEYDGLSNDVQLGTRVLIPDIPKDRAEELPPRVEEIAPDGDQYYDCLPS